MSKTTWRAMIGFAMEEVGEGWGDVVEMAPKDSGWLQDEFDNGYGGEQGIPFTVWTANRVYFPACYDGAEWVESVSRNPDGKPTDHVGG